jgi:hypothetical protein
LDKVLLLNQQKKQALSVIKGTKTKKVGLHQLTITQEEKVQTTSKANKFYDAKISTIYKNMNLELKNAGHEELENPYQIMKGGN